MINIIQNKIQSLKSSSVKRNMELDNLASIVELFKFMRNKKINFKGSLKNVEKRIKILEKNPDSAGKHDYFTY